MTFSSVQERTIAEIERVMDYFGKDRWFIQQEIIGAGHHTIRALVNKGYLRTKIIGSLSYYQIKITDIK
jgi:hypothetical protein